jgi:hypothetical protein
MACWRVLSLQLASGGSSRECAPVGPSSVGWNDMDMTSALCALALAIAAVRSDRQVRERHGGCWTTRL